MNFPGGSDGKESAYNAGNTGSITGLGRSPGEGNGNLLQYRCLENSMDRGAWQAAVHGLTKMDGGPGLETQFLTQALLLVQTREHCVSKATLF